VNSAIQKLFETVILPHVIRNSFRRIEMYQAIRVTVVSLLASLFVVGCTTPEPQAEESEPAEQVPAPEESDPEPAAEADPESESYVESEGEVVCGQSIDAYGAGNVELEADLNGNGRIDMVRENTNNCGPSSCTALVLVACEVEGYYEEVAEFGYFQIVEVAEGTTDGWRDLAVNKASRDDAGLLDATTVIYRWNGETYAPAE
jgi:hypothetical protein